MLQKLELGHYLLADAQLNLKMDILTTTTELFNLICADLKAVNETSTEVSGIGEAFQK